MAIKGCCHPIDTFSFPYLLFLAAWILPISCQYCMLRRSLHNYKCIFSTPISWNQFSCIMWMGLLCPDTLRTRLSSDKGWWTGTGGRILRLLRFHPEWNTMQLRFVTLLFAQSYQTLLLSLPSSPCLSFSLLSISHTFASSLLGPPLPHPLWSDAIALFNSSASRFQGLICARNDHAAVKCSNGLTSWHHT